MPGKPSPINPNIPPSTSHIQGPKTKPPIGHLAQPFPHNPGMHMTDKQIRKFWNKLTTEMLKTMKHEYDKMKASMKKMK